MGNCGDVLISAAQSTPHTAPATEPAASAAALKAGRFTKLYPLQTEQMSNASNSPPCIQLHTPAGSNLKVLRSSSAADRQVTAACVSTVGRAFAGDKYIQRVFAVRPGNEPTLLEGLSRVYLERFRDAQLLYHTHDCRSAAIVYTSEQSDALDNQFSFSILCSILPGVLHMLRALPLRSLPTLLSLVDRMSSAGAAAVKAAGVTGSYLKLIVVATHPEDQRQGLGTAVLQAVAADADRQQLPLYLEAIEDHLLPWYQRHGFVCIGEVDVKPGDHSRVVQLMLRMPQQQQQQQQQSS